MAQLVYMRVTGSNDEGVVIDAYDKIRGYEDKMTEVPRKGIAGDTN